MKLKNIFKNAKNIENKQHYIFMKNKKNSLKKKFKLSKYQKNI